MDITEEIVGKKVKDVIQFLESLNERQREFYLVYEIISADFHLESDEVDILLLEK